MEATVQQSEPPIVMGGEGLKGLELSVKNCHF